MYSMDIYFRKKKSVRGIEKGNRVGEYLVSDLISNGFGFRRVKKIVYVGKKDTYDIEVDGEHNFIANGVVVHNSEWEEWVGSRTEARNTGDYWVDYWEGILYVNMFWYYQGGKEVKVAYLYGRSDLPMEVKELTVIVAAKYILTMERRWLTVMEGSGSLSIQGMLSVLNDRQERLESMLRALKIPRTTFM